MRFAGVFPQKLVPLAPLLAILLFAAGGCASRRPATVVLEQQPKTIARLNAQGSTNLKLVTFNIWGLPRWMTGAPPGRYPRIAEEIERLDPDIVLLQEAWTSRARRAIPTNGCWFVARAAGQHTFFQQTGLITLSKFPVIGGEFYPFSRAAFPDRLVNKGALKVTVQMPGGRLLNIWNVHLQDAGATTTRETQVRELIARIQATDDGQVADIVGGDFNCTPESPLYQRLASNLGPNLQQISGAAQFITWDGLSSKTDAGQTIDYFFVRERIRFANMTASEKVAFTNSATQQRLSDHFGIEATLSLDSESTVAGKIQDNVEGPQFPAILAHRAP